MQVTSQKNTTVLTRLYTWPVNKENIIESTILWEIKEATKLKKNKTVAMGEFNCPYIIWSNATLGHRESIS